MPKFRLKPPPWSTAGMAREVAQKHYEKGTVFEFNKEYSSNAWRVSERGLENLWWDKEDLIEVKYKIVLVLRRKASGISNP